MLKKQYLNKVNRGYSTSSLQVFRIRSAVHTIFYFFLRLESTARNQFGTPRLTSSDAELQLQYTSKCFCAQWQYKFTSFTTFQIMKFYRFTSNNIETTLRTSQVLSCHPLPCLIKHIMFLFFLVFSKMSTPVFQLQQCL